MSEVSAVRQTGQPETIVLNMGPQHPSTHGVLHVIVELEGERVVRADPCIGYLHRGIEKLAEHRTYPQITPLFDRLDYVTGGSNELAFILAVEDMGGFEVPERAQYIRVILAELYRISSHLIWAGTFGLDMGALTPFFYTFREREETMNIFEMVTGARLFPNYLRAGGVKEDLPPGALEKIHAFAEDMPRCVDQYEAMMTGNEIFQGRTRGISPLTTEQALDLGVTGPLLRATGLASDLRKDAPYAVYQHLDFDVATAEGGDCWARYQVRIKEMRESARIVKQACEQMPEGEVRNKVPRKIRLPEGETYTRIESSRGVLGVYLVSDGADMPYRLKIRPPSFINLSALPHLARGWKIADTVAVIGSLDIVLGEIDR